MTGDRGMPPVLVVDSGTTTTRVRSIVDGKVVWTGAEEAGARDTAITGTTDKIREALHRLIGEAREQSGATVEAVVCSGMITSNMGLLEVAHVPAPATRSDIADHVVRHDLPDVTDLPFLFVPGVKTKPPTFDLTSLDQSDVLRGEECEIEGLRIALGLDRPATFLHFGSHHKAIDVDRDGRITGSRTAVTGELFMAVVEHTILRSSTVGIADVELHEDYVQAGIDACIRHGASRALFLVRVGEQLWSRNRDQMTSFLLGVLAATDLPLVGAPERVRSMVLYGKGPFPRIIFGALEARGHQVEMVDEGVADESAAVGAASFYDMARDRLERGAR